jgi:hypothetical protein
MSDDNDDDVRPVKDVRFCGHCYVVLGDKLFATKYGQWNKLTSITNAIIVRQQQVDLFECFYMERPVR